MGATLYINFTPYCEDPAQALLAVQCGIIDESFDVETVVQEQLDAARSSLIDVPDDDEYGLADQYREEVEFLEGLAEKPLPENDERKVAYIRAAYRFDECGMGNILDIRGVTEAQREFAAAPASPEAIQAIIGHVRPTAAEARKIAFGLNETLGRAECLYFHVYDDDNDAPTQICFVGNTVD